VRERQRAQLLVAAFHAERQLRVHALEAGDRSYPPTTTRRAQDWVGGKAMVPSQRRARWAGFPWSYVLARPA